MVYRAGSRQAGRLDGPNPRHHGSLRPEGSGRRRSWFRTANLGVREQPWGLLSPAEGNPLEPSGFLVHRGVANIGWRVPRAVPSMWQYVVRILSVSATRIAGVVSSFISGLRGASELAAAESVPAHSSSAVNRSEIERALDDLASYEEGFKFQSLAVVLAKRRWPDLIASERKWDLGLDAYVAALVPGSVRTGLACSLTATLGKITEDAKRIKEKHSDFGTLIFCTLQKVTNHTAKKWADEIKKAFGFRLIIVSREDLITSLMDPANASLCATHLGISIQPIEATRDSLEAARQACSEEVEQWLQHPRLLGTPLIRLRLSRVSDPNEDTAEPVDLEAIQEELAFSRRLVLEAHAGAGKTTTLVQLAKLMVDADVLCLIVDLPIWITSDCDILVFVARSPNFRSRSIGADDLARLSRTEHINFLLNGWNEISESQFESASQRLADLERTFPAAGIILATRTHVIKPPLPGASRIQVLELSEEQRSDYIGRALDWGGTELLLRINEDPILDKLTRTPLILSEVTRLFKSGRPIPKTKLDILRAMAERIEDSDEHRSQLQTVPLLGQSESYLSALAFTMTPEGEVNINENNARRTVSQEVTSLRNTGQLATAPEAASVLNALCAHHVLERINYPNTTFRFQHQQFQEFYAALRVVRLLEKLVSTQDPDAIQDFQAQYLDQPVWGESLQMIAAAVGAQSPVFRPDTDTVEVGECLVRWAIAIDPIFAAALSRDCGDQTWSKIGADLGECLRRWYAVADEHHRRCALAGMLATGSADFIDIIIPLVTSDHQQVRLRTYRALGEFRVSSLGADWRKVVNGWGEEQRVDFLHEVSGRAGLADVAEHFAQTDPSESVQAEAIQVLSWLGSIDAINRVCADLSDEALVESLRRGMRIEELPASLRPRLAAIFRKNLEDMDSAGDRLRTLSRAAELGDPDAPNDLKTELDALAKTDLKDLEGLLDAALAAVDAVDGRWSSRWIAERIADGLLWADRWIGRVAAIEPELVGRLLERISSEEVEPRKLNCAISLLTKAADEKVAETIFRKLYDRRTRLLETNERRGDSSGWAIFRQLRDLARELPPPRLVSGILNTLPTPPTLSELSAILDVLRDEEARFQGQFIDADRQSLLDVLVRAVPLVLGQDDLSGNMKADLALALAQIGDRETAKHLQSLIQADIDRVRRGQAARSRGEHGSVASGAAMRWSHWHVEAVTWLGADVAEPILLGVLTEPEYEPGAAWALARLAVPPPTVNANLGIASAPPIDDAAPGKVVDEERRVKYAEAITAQIHSLLEQRSETANPDSLNSRVTALAGVLAYLDGLRSADLVLQTMALPGTYDIWSRVKALENLLRRHSRLPTDATLAVINPAVEHIVNQGLHDQQNDYLLQRCLCVLPLVDDPTRGIGRIRQIMSSVSLPDYRLRELVTALGRSGSEESFLLLVEIAHDGERVPDALAGEWINAVATIDLPSSNRLLISFVDPDVTEWNVSISSNLNHTVAVHIAALAEKDPNVGERVFELCRAELSLTQRQILTNVLALMNTTEAVLAGLDLIDDSLSPPVPFELVRAIEDILVARRPHGSSGVTYNLMPQSGGQIRRRLIELVLNDAHRRRFAFGLLGEIEGWRLDYGKPVSESRHPAVDCGHPWPPLEFVSANELTER